MSKRTELEIISKRIGMAIANLLAACDDAEGLAGAFDESADNQEERFPSKAEIARENADNIREWADTIRSDAESIDFDPPELS